LPGLTFSPCFRSCSLLGRLYFMTLFLWAAQGLFSASMPLAYRTGSLSCLLIFVCLFLLLVLTFFSSLQRRHSNTPVVYPSHAFMCRTLIRPFFSDQVCSSLIRRGRAFPFTFFLLTSNPGTPVFAILKQQLRPTSSDDVFLHFRAFLGFTFRSVPIPFGSRGLNPSSQLKQKDFEGADPNVLQRQPSFLGPTSICPFFVPPPYSCLPSLNDPCFTHGNPFLIHITPWLVSPS